MQDEAELFHAAFALLDQQRASGRVDLRDVADSVLRRAEASQAVAKFSADYRRRLGCELIKSELSRRWEEASAAAQSRCDVAELPAESEAGGSSATLGLLQRINANPAIPKELRPPSLESFLGEWRGELDDFTSVVELSVYEFSARRISGDEPQIAEYEQRFADLADVLRDRLTDVEESLDVESSIRGLLRETDPLFRLRQEQALAAASNSELEANGGDPFILDVGNNEQALLDRALRRVEFFCDLSPTMRMAVVEKLELSPFAAGDVLMRQGDVADGLLVLLEGTTRVAVEENGRTHDIARLVRRAVVGEMGLVTQSKRTASIVAETAGWAASLSRADFEVLASANPLLRVSLSELIASRLGTVTVDALCGKHIDRYEIRQRLGRGGMGIVYLAVDRKDARPIALKMLPHDRALDLLSSRRFRQEADFIRNLNHPNIVRVLHEFSAFGTTFIAMEWCDGPALADVIRRAAPLPAHIVRKLVGQLAAGLSHTHAAGIAHRDLKPTNVLLTRQGDVKLVDFGLARSMAMNESELTGIGEMIGTPRYMSPEQIEGDRGDHRSDFFSLGCIAFELWTGKPPFRATRWREMLRERMRWTLPEPDELDPPMDRPMHALLRGSLREEPRERDVNLAQIATWAGPIDWTTLPELEDLFTPFPLA